MVLHYVNNVLCVMCCEQMHYTDWFFSWVLVYLESLIRIRTKILFYLFFVYGQIVPLQCRVVSSELKPYSSMLSFHKIEWVGEGACPVLLTRTCIPIVRTIPFLKHTGEFVSQ